MDRVEVVDLSADERFVKCPRCRSQHPCKDNFWELCDRCCSTLLTLDDEITLPLENNSGTITMKEIKDGIRSSYQKQRERYIG